MQPDKPSSLLTTFNTPFGRYRWLRLPFGIKTATEEYQRRIHESLQGLKGVEDIVDENREIGKIVRENAFDEKKRRPGLKFNPGLALIGLRTTGPRIITKYSMESFLSNLR